jgi:anthranilate synthase component 1
MALRVLRFALEPWVDPAEVFAAGFSQDTDVVWLDSGQDSRSGKSYLARGARSISSNEIDGPVLEFLRTELAKTPVESVGQGFALGWVGWLGYELRFETMAQPRSRASRYPDAAFLFIDRAIEFDHATGEVSLIALAADWVGEIESWRRSTVALLAALQGSAPTRHTPITPPVGSAHWRDSADDYLRKIAACKVAIVEGDAYQLCLTTSASIDATPDPADTYLALRAASPSHHGALLRIGDVSLLSSSPEQFLTVSPTGVIDSRPIKGTRKRGSGVEDDEALKVELLSSDKERAENLMIVDLVRNDIARVSEVGSVEVPTLLAVETYAQVHQLVSTVRGRLAKGRDGLDAVAACFPAGSMTGAPKLSATRILDRLEGEPRGIYSGAFGYFGLDGRIDLAMVIRTIIIDSNGTTVGAGGGITALSVPEEELAEVRLKAAALLRVLGVDA